MGVGEEADSMQPSGVTAMAVEEKFRCRRRRMGIRATRTPRLGNFEQEPSGRALTSSTEWRWKGGHSRSRGAGGFGYPAAQVHYACPDPSVGLHPDEWALRLAPSRFVDFEE